LFHYSQHSYRSFGFGIPQSDPFFSFSVSTQHLFVFVLVREKLEKEIDANVDSGFFDMDQESTGDINYEKLMKMPYLNAVINETLRLYPSAGFTRTPVKNTTLGKHEIPRNMEIVVFPWLVHRHPDYYEDPEKYDPERWLGSKEKVEKAKSYFLPFSLGNRNCVGLNLAYTELRVIYMFFSLRIYHFFSLTTVHYAIPELFPSTTMRILYFVLFF
jgi:cytochrome P450